MSVWQPVFYKRSTGTVPGLVFLKKIDQTPRRELLKIIAAVVQVGPHRYPSGMGWQLMHKPKKKGEVDMSGLYEARDKHGDTLYRLFCKVDGEAQDFGLELPSLVILGGGEKKVREEMKQSVYRTMVARRRDYEKHHRVAETSDFPAWWP